jgi:multidrug efflux pump subunit AcrA (membrane-fusion protein)
MVWKILSGISAACLAGASYFAWINSEQVKTEKELLARAESNLQQLESRKMEAVAAQERKQEQLAQVEKDRDATKEDVVKVTAEAQEKEAALALLKNNLDQVVQQVAALDAKIKDAGDIKALIAQIDALKKDQQAAEGEVANKEQMLAQAQQQLVGLKDQVKGFQAYQERVSRGVVEPDFSARVSGVFDDWGFVVLNKGNNGGVFANALLEVKRGKEVIAKLKVKNVEPAISIADVVKGSLVEGEFIRSGDMVVAAADQPAIAGGSKAGGAAALGADGGAMQTAPPAEGAMGSDPFGGAPAMEGGAPAPASDPFGGAPAMDGGAPASDPFGAAPAMDGGAPAPASDPFGAAPAMEGAEAPAKSDPFGN